MYFYCDNLSAMGGHWFLEEPAWGIALFMKALAVSAAARTFGMSLSQDQRGPSR